MVERGGSGKHIVLGLKPGTLIIIENGKEPVVVGTPKEIKTIRSDILGNLKSLAFILESNIDDSLDQQFLNDELEKLKTKYPGEQPEEVWRRSLATCVSDGVGIKDVASALLNTNIQYKIGKHLGTIGETEKADRLQMLEDGIREYWPMHK